MHIGFYGIVKNIFSRDTFSINLILLNMYHNFENCEMCLFTRLLSHGKTVIHLSIFFQLSFFNNYFLKLLQKLKEAPYIFIIAMHM